MWSVLISAHEHTLFCRQCEFELPALAVLCCECTWTRRVVWNILSYLYSLYTTTTATSTFYSTIIFQEYEGINTYGRTEGTINWYYRAVTITKFLTTEEEEEKGKGFIIVVYNIIDSDISNYMKYIYQVHACWYKIHLLIVDDAFVAIVVWIRLAYVWCECDARYIMMALKRVA